MLPQVDMHSALVLIQKLKSQITPLGADDIRRINEWLFLPPGPVPGPLDFCLILGSRSCEYRVQAALDHCGQGPHRFIVSGGGLDEAGRTEAHRMRRYLQQHGIGADAILEEAASRHTRENLSKTRGLLSRLGHGQRALKILLVTGGFHLRRTALLLAEEWGGLHPWEVSYHPAYGPHTHPDRWHESAEGRELVGSELAKIFAMAAPDQEAGRP